MRADLPDLEWVAVVGDDAGPGDLRFDDLDRGRTARRCRARSTRANPRSIAYTSGTTSDPKGVVHAHRTIGAEIRQLGAIQPAGPAALVGAPVGHGIGMLAALLLPVYRRRPIHLIDVWDPGARARGDARGRTARPGRVRRTSSQPARPSRLRSRAARARSCPSSASAVRPSRPRWASAPNGSASRRRAASAAPSIRRSPAARPTRRARSA